MAGKNTLAPAPHASWSDAQKQKVEESLRKVVPDYKITDYKRVHTFIKSQGLETLLQIRDYIRSDPYMREDGVVVKELEGIPEAWLWSYWCRILMPEYTPNPLDEIKWWAWVEYGRGQQKCHNWWGGQSTIKSGFMAKFILTHMLTWGKYTIGYVAGPYKNATDDKVWKELTKDAFGKAAEAVNALSEPYEDSGKKPAIATNEYFRINCIGIGEAEVKFVSLRENAAVRGKKALTKRKREGISILAMDEGIENESLQAISGWSNFSNNMNSYFLTGCNPNPLQVKQPGVYPLAEPVDGRHETDMSREDDWAWRTRYGWVFRLGWLSDVGIGNIPNLVLGKDYYPFMMNQRNIDVISEWESHMQAAEMEAWGFDGSGSDRLTDTARQRMGGVFDNFRWHTREKRWISLDPAHGGKDPCVITQFQSGIVYRETMENMQQVIVVEKQKILPSKRDFRASKEMWEDVDRLVKSGYMEPEAREEFKKFSNKQEGKVTTNAQVVLGVMMEMMNNQIPKDHLVTDGSQRPDFMNMLYMLLGRQNIKYHYEGTRKVSEELPNWRVYPFRKKEGLNEPLLWKDKCMRSMSAMSMEFCEAGLHDGRVLGAENMKKGLSELHTRPLEMSRGSKIDLISKGKLTKSRASGGLGLPSPAYAETLAMGWHFGVHYLNALNLGDDEDKMLATGGSSASFDFDDWEFQPRLTI